MSVLLAGVVALVVIVVTVVALILFDRAANALANAKRREDA